MRLNHVVLLAEDTLILSCLEFTNAENQTLMLVFFMTQSDNTGRMAVNKSLALEKTTVHPCPDCGARLSASETCHSIFDAFLALEFSDPAYGEVHFLTVACFMIQHNRYSDEALAWIQPQLRAFLEEGESQEAIRRRASTETGNGQRDWKVKRSPQARPLPKVPWQVTIADVAAHAVDAVSYREWVRRWGAATLKQMDAFFG